MKKQLLKPYSLLNLKEQSKTLVEQEPILRVENWNLTLKLCCVDVILAGNFSCLPRSTSICQSVVEVMRPGFARCCVSCFFSSCVERDGVHLVVALSGVTGCGYAVRNCPQHLVVAPSRAPVFKGFWTAAEVFQGSLSWTLRTGWCLYFSGIVEHCRQLGLKSQYQE